MLTGRCWGDHDPAGEAAECGPLDTRVAFFSHRTPLKHLSPSLSSSHLAPHPAGDLLPSPPFSSSPFLLTLLCPSIQIRMPYLHTLHPSPPSRLLFMLQPSSLPPCSPPSHLFLLNFPFSPLNVLKNNRTAPPSFHQSTRVRSLLFFCCPIATFSALPGAFSSRALLLFPEVNWKNKASSGILPGSA